MEKKRKITYLCELERVLLFLLHQDILPNEGFLYRSKSKKRRQIFYVFKYTRNIHIIISDFQARSL